MLPGIDRHPGPRPRTWRPMVGWTLGILAVLGLAWFVGAVAVPVMRTRAIVADYAAANNWTSLKVPAQPAAGRAIEALGGEDRALPALQSYMGWPEWAAWDKGEAALLMARCGQRGVDALVHLAATSASPRVRACCCMALAWTSPPAKSALPVLARLLQDGDAEVRAQACRALVAIGPSKDELPLLKVALGDRDGSVRRRAALALGSLGPLAADAIPELETLLRDSQASVREAAAEALKKIRGRADQADRPSLQQLERELLDGKGKWADAYRALVGLGEPGWEIILRSEFLVAPHTEHLRGVGADLGGVAKVTREAFYSYYDERIDKMLADEKWATSYARSLCTNSGFDSHLHEDMAARLMAKRQRPREARLEIAILRVSCGAVLVQRKMESGLIG